MIKLKYGNGQGHDTFFIWQSMIRHFIAAKETKQSDRKFCDWCQKQCYETAEDADGQIRIARCMDGVDLSKYYCDYSNSWHLTKK